MKSKLLLLSLSVAAGVTLLSGCGSQAAAPAAANTASTTTTTAAKTDAPKTDATKADAATGASMATDNASFEKAISKDGSFIILTKGDLTFTNDLTVDGTFTKKDAKTGKDVPTRSLAFATTKPDKSIDQRFTVTVPRLVINSENTLLEDGIVKGDIYVQAPGFITSDATIDGNLYFANDDLKNAFKVDAKTKITGQVAVKAYTK